MNIPRRTAFFDSPVALAACAAAALLAGWALAGRAAKLFVEQSVADVAEGTITSSPARVLETVPLHESYASVLKPSESIPRVPSVELSMRFRLVGSMADGAGDSEVWTVILEDTQLRRQLRAKPGDEILPECKIVETGSSFAKVDTPDGEQTIGRGSASSSVRSATSGSSASRDADAGGLDAFGGRQIEDHRWEFSRESLMDYYRELLANPDRLVAVFDSLEPNYTDDGKIDGYRLNVLGEAEFFKAVGFDQGDIVRVVNGVQMTNRRRAENFIRRVVEDGLDTLVIEYDRGDEKLKNIYQTF